mgnify:CR=1 FL=1
MVIISKLFKLYMLLACHSYSMSGELTKTACYSHEVFRFSMHLGV